MRRGSKYLQAYSRVAGRKRRAEAMLKCLMLQITALDVLMI